MKLTPLFLLLFLFIGFKSYAQDKLINKADSLLNARDYKKAIDEYTKILAKNPDNEMALRGRGYCYIFLARYDKGEADYKKALKVNPRCFKCEVNLMTSYNLSGKTSLALSKADSNLQILGDTASKSNWYAEIQFFKANIYIGKEENTKAKEALDKVVEMYPDSAWAYFSRADFNLYNQSKSEALKDIDKAIQLNSSIGKYYRLKAQIFAAIKYNEDALALLNKAIELDSNDAASHYQKAEILFTAYKKTNEALVSITKAIQADSSNWQYYLFNGEIYHTLEDMDGECYCYQKSLPLTEADSTNEAAIWYKEVFKRALKTFCNKNNPSYYYQRGIAMYNVSLYDSAVTYYTTGLKKFPGHPLLFNFRGNAFLELKEWDKAEKDYITSLRDEETLKNFIKEETTNPQTDISAYANGLVSSAWFNLSEVYINKDNYQKALRAIDTAITILRPGKDIPLQDYYNQKGRVHMAMQEYDIAFENFEKTKMLAPSDSRGYLNMALALANKASGKKDKYMHFSVSAKTSTITGFNFESEPIKLTNTSSQLLNEALTYCDKAVALNAPDNGQSYLIRGYIKYLKSSPSACQDVRVAIQQGNPDATAYYQHICK